MSDQAAKKIARARFEVVQQEALVLGHVLPAWERATWTDNEVFLSKCTKCGQTAIVRLGDIPQYKQPFDLPPICSLEAAAKQPQRTHFPGMIL